MRYKISSDAEKDIHEKGEKPTLTITVENLGEMNLEKVKPLLATNNVHVIERFGDSYFFTTEDLKVNDKKLFGIEEMVELKFSKSKAKSKSKKSKSKSKKSRTKSAAKKL